MKAVDSGDVAKQQSMVDAAAKAASPEQNPLMKAVKKLTGKD